MKKLFKKTILILTSALVINIINPLNNIQTHAETREYDLNCMKLCTADDTTVTMTKTNQYYIDAGGSISISDITIHGCNDQVVTCSITIKGPTGELWTKTQSAGFNYIVGNCRPGANGCGWNNLDCYNFGCEHHGGTNAGGSSNKTAEYYHHDFVNEKTYVLSGTKINCTVDGIYTITMTRTANHKHENNDAPANNGIMGSAVVITSPWEIVTCVDINEVTDEVLSTSTIPLDDVIDDVRVKKSTYDGKIKFKADKTASGADWGSDDTVNAYYQGYYYDYATEITVQLNKSCEVEIGDDNKVKSAGQNVVYRYFRPIDYTVNIHPNQPTDATHDIQSKVPSSYEYDDNYNPQDAAGIWKVLNTYTTFNTNNYSSYTRNFKYDVTRLDRPSDSDDDTNYNLINYIYKLQGWHVDNYNYWYGTQGTNGSASNPLYHAYDEGYEDDSTNIKNAGMKLTTTPGEELNLYPNWVKNKYTIHYKDNNEQTINIYGDTITQLATGNTPDTTAEYDSWVQLATNQFTRYGYTFKEWNTKPDGSGTAFYDGEKAYKPNLAAHWKDNDEITLYAIWEPIKYNIRFNSNDLEPLSQPYGNWNEIDSYLQQEDFREYELIRDFERKVGKKKESLENRDINKEPAKKLESTENQDVDKGYKGIRFDEWIDFKPNIYKRTASKDKPIKLSDGTDITEGYNWLGWTDKKDTWSDCLATQWKDSQLNNQPCWKDEYHVRNFTVHPVPSTLITQGKIFDLYALWQKDITLIFDLNQGSYLGDDTQQIILETSIFNNQYNYTFDILDIDTQQVTPAKKNYYITQLNHIDAYGDWSYDTNGINTKYRMYDEETGCIYRFLGWSHLQSAEAPELATNDFETYNEKHAKTKNFDAYNKTGHTETYTIYNNNILYAIWEPVLAVNVETTRTLGKLNFSNGYVSPYPERTKTLVANVNINSFEQSRVYTNSIGERPYNTGLLIKPGEQAQWSVLYAESIKYKRVPDSVEVTYDTRMKNIYADSSQYYYDKLNPDKLNNVLISKPKPYEIKKFYIPNYLGTGKSKNEAPYNNTNYMMYLKLQQDSYFYKNYVEGYDKEAIYVNCHIYIDATKVPEKDPDPDPDDTVDPDPDPDTDPDPKPEPDPGTNNELITTLDELRTKLKIRIN